jgi:D-threo-aldose 1-dehydrogenase
LRKLDLFPGAPPTTNLGFGTTSMMGLASTQERLAILESAFDAGIRHFDTAPYYGYGEAERIVGECFRARRDQITITTKYGLQPPAVLKLRWVNHTARSVLRGFPFLRKRLSRQAHALSNKGLFNSGEAQRSLDRSLAALKTDYVDLFLLHEPSFDDAASDEMTRFLEEELRKGRVLAFGCSGDAHVMHRIAAAGIPTAGWLQFEDSSLKRNIEAIRSCGMKSITYGSFKALASLRHKLNSEVTYREWDETLGCDCRSEATLAGLLQAAALMRNHNGIVLFSTRKKEHIASAVKVASGELFSREQILRFDELCVRVELTH